MEPPETAIFLVTQVFDLAGRRGLLVSGRTLEGKVRKGMVLQDDSHRQARVLELEFLSPRDVATGEVTILLERTEPSPAHENAILWTVDDSGRRPPRAAFFAEHFAEHPYSNVPPAAPPPPAPATLPPDRQNEGVTTPRIDSNWKAKLRTALYRITGWLRFSRQ